MVSRRDLSRGRSFLASARHPPPPEKKRSDEKKKKKNWRAKNSGGFLARKHATGGVHVPHGDTFVTSGISTILVNARDRGRRHDFSAVSRHSQGRTHPLRQVSREQRWFFVKIRAQEQASKRPVAIAALEPPFFVFFSPQNLRKISSLPLRDRQQPGGRFAGSCARDSLAHARCTCCLLVCACFVSRLRFSSLLRLFFRSGGASGEPSLFFIGQRGNGGGRLT